MDYQGYLRRTGRLQDESTPKKEECTSKEIDWEQRRYEIAKNMLPSIYLDEGQQDRAGNYNVEFEYQDIISCAKEAVRFADALIYELKTNKLVI